MQAIGKEQFWSTIIVCSKKQRSCLSVRSLSMHALKMHWLSKNVFCHFFDCRYSAHAPRATPPTWLACAAADNWSKDSAILHLRKNSVGFDSLHHNKNENFAPVTLLTTVNFNESGYMVLSELKHILGYWSALILEMCSRHLHLWGHSDDHIGTILDRDKGCDWSTGRAETLRLYFAFTEALQWNLIVYINRNSSHRRPYNGRNCQHQEGDCKHCLPRLGSWSLHDWPRLLENL